MRQWETHPESPSIVHCKKDEGGDSETGPVALDLREDQKPWIKHRQLELEVQRRGRFSLCLCTQ